MRFAATLLIVPVVLIAPARGQITAERVRESIAGGVTYLKSQQNPERGNWSEHVGYPGGVTSLCTLALVNCGESPESPAIQAALRYLRSIGNPGMTYATSLQTMVFCAAAPEQDRLLIRRNAEWLQEAQIKSGPNAGAWGYNLNKGDGDNSNTQFALLALHEASRVGVEVDEGVWQRSLEYWLSLRRVDGSWTYNRAAHLDGTSSSGSMTCAGISSLIICSNQLSEGDARLAGDHVECCGQQRNEYIEGSLAWLGRKFTVESNPGGLGYQLYYLYGMERVGRLTGQRFFTGASGRHDWFRLGAEVLVRKQDKFSHFWRNPGHAEDNPHIATSLALLFLSKGRRPVVISRLQYGVGDEWNQHRGALQNLTRHVEKAWQRELTWQTIDVKLARVEDLMQTPVLFISGRNDLDLSAAQIDNLREYVNQGGFIFAESCCGGAGFDISFKALVKELFPNSALRPLPPEHPIWFAQKRVDPKYFRGLYGVEACCRTSIVYCPDDLSCYWELAREARLAKYSAEVKNRVAACVNTGINVLAYATNRRLKEKLEEQRIAKSSSADLPTRGVLWVPKLTHGGGSDDAPNALQNLLNLFREQTELRTRQHDSLAATAANLAEFPILFTHGRRDFEWSPGERQALAHYLRRGGFLFADAICASPQFANAFRRECQKMFPESEFVRLPTEHDLFTTRYRGYDVARVRLRDPQARVDAANPLEVRVDEAAPLLEGLKVDGRIAVILSPYDLSCGLENAASLECKGYLPEDAARLGVNILLFGLQQ